MHPNRAESIRVGVPDVRVRFPIFESWSRNPVEISAQNLDTIFTSRHRSPLEPSDEI